MNIKQLNYGNESDPLIELIKLNNINNASATIGTVAFKAGQRIPEGDGRSVHNQDEVSLVLDGKIRLDTEEQSTTLESGALVRIPAGTPHSSVAIEDTKIYFMLIG